MALFGSSSDDKVYAVQEARIADLKEQIARLTTQWEAERAEYKRAMDVILVKNNLPAVGQGAPTSPGVMDPTKLFAFLEEEVADEKRTI